MRLVLLSFACSLVLPSTSLSQWLPNGTPICTAGGDQRALCMIADGSGGAILAWWDERNNPAGDLYAQRVDPGGVVQWTTDGEALCVGTSAGGPVMASDDAQGAIVVWVDSRVAGHPHVYAQRVDASGSLPWGTLLGVPLCEALEHQVDPVVVSDGQGGAIAAWVDYRKLFPGLPAIYGIYAQRINAAGVVQWATDGVLVGNIMWSVQQNQAPAIASDGANGAVITWLDVEQGVSTKIYAQRVNAAGVVQWATPPPVCTAPGVRGAPTMAALRNGGAVVGWMLAWWDARNNDLDIYARALDPSGNLLGTADGVKVCTEAGIQAFPTIVGDDTGGAIVAWEDGRFDPNRDTYAQHVDGAANSLWTTNGIAVCATATSQEFPKMTIDDAGGAIVAWWERGTPDGIRAQRVDGGGSIQWIASGIDVCTLPTNVGPRAIVTDAARGAIVCWDDDRLGTYDVYAWRMGPDGQPATGVGPAPSFSGLILNPNFPNPFATTTSLEFKLAADSDVEITVYDVAGRELRRIGLPGVSAGAQQVAFDGLDDTGRPLPSGVYFYRVRAAGETVTRKLVITR